MASTIKRVLSVLLCGYMAMAAYAVPSVEHEFSHLNNGLFREEALTLRLDAGFKDQLITPGVFRSAFSRSRRRSYVRRRYAFPGAAVMAGMVDDFDDHYEFPL